jgi:thioredoxin reductase (NADPH)
VAKFANSVTIVHRKDKFRASKIMQDKVFANKKIKVIWNTTVEEILGDEKVTGVKLKNITTNQVSEMKIDGVFMAIGYSPNTDVFKGKLELDEQGYLVTKEEVLTKVEGVYVAGDVADKFYRQAITASGSGVKCALHVREYLSSLYYKRSLGK